MTRVVLFAETPRAGAIGHRFIVPSELVVSESTLAEFFHIADRDVSVGENFISIGRSVTQRSSVGTVRVGREIIVLAGINVLQVQANAFALIVKMLLGYLDRLEQLVVDGIDWDRMIQAEVVVRRTELIEWLDDLKEVPLPVTEWREGPRPLRAERLAQKQLYAPPIRKVSWSSGIVMLIAFLTGCLVGGLNGKLFSRSKKLELPDRPITAEGFNSPKTKSRGDADPTTAGVTSKDESSRADVSTVITSLLRKAIDSGNVGVFVEVLSWMPSDASVSDQDFDAIIGFCSRLIESRLFDDGARVVNQVSRLKEAVSLDSGRAARLEDLQRKAREGCEAINQQDRHLYESIRASSSTPQVEAARKYLKLGPKQTMSGIVKLWLEMAEKPIDADIIGVNVPTEGPLIVWFIYNQREIGLRVASGDHITSSSPLPLSFVMAHLGITRRNLPAAVRIIVKPENNVSPLTPLPFGGDFSVSEQTKVITHLTLQSSGLRRQEGMLTLRLPKIKSIPEMPEWRREMP